MGKNRNILQSDWVDSLSSLAPEALVREVRRQSKPRRWPWQPKTLRDLVNERQAHMSDVTAERSAELAALLADRRDRVKETLRHQSKPRRYPWQQKTARDHLDDRLGKMTELAAERSAELAALAATRRDNIFGRIEAETHHRRYPWQKKTARDRFDERVDSLTNRAASRRDELAEQVQSARDELLSQFEHEARGRRLPWQHKTARDKVEDQASLLAGEAASRKDELTGRFESARADLLGRLEQENNGRRFPWQRKTMRDKAEEQLSSLADDATTRRDELAEQVESARADLLGRLEQENSGRRFPWQRRTMRETAEDRLSEMNGSFSDANSNMQGVLKTAPAALGAAALSAVEAVKGSADSTGSSLREGADVLSKRMSDTREQAAANVRAVAKAPAKAINRKVESGKRTVRWSARVVKATFWALLIGAAIGVLYSPRSGREIRAEIRKSIVDLLDIVLPA